MNDANTPYFRVNFSGGNQGVFFQGNSSFAAVPQSVAGVRPALPKRDNRIDGRPDFRPNIPCETQDPPNLQGAKGGVSQSGPFQPEISPETLCRLLEDLPGDLPVSLGSILDQLPGGNPVGGGCP
jgi:hypothetical protein